MNRYKYLQLYVFFSVIFFASSPALAQLKEIVEVSLVDLYVSALDSDGRPIRDLSKGDFILKEDGIAQPITNFSNLVDPESQIPLTIVFLVDTSGSMHLGTDKLKRIDIAKRFASLILKEIKPQDTMQVLAFDNIYRSLTPMTSDPIVIDKALSQVRVDAGASPGTALLFSVNRTIKHFQQFWGRKIMILCSDGQNNAPGPEPNSLVESLKRNDITLLALSPLENRDLRQQRELHLAEGVYRYDEPDDRSFEARKGKKLLKKLSQETGGYAFFPENVSEMNDSITKLRSVIRSQYALGYKPSKKSGKGWRKIEVKCKRKDVRLRYRKGFYMD